MNGFDREEYEDEYDGLAAKEYVNSIFRTFIPKDVAASWWIDALAGNGYRKGEKRGRKIIADYGFFMSDEMQEVGVLSIAPALSVFLSELSLLKNGDGAGDGLAFEKAVAYKSPNLEIVTNSIIKLLLECYPQGVKGYCDDINNVLFSSMPFYDDKTAEDSNGWETGGYLDAASWVFLAADSIEAFLNRLEDVAPDVYKKLEWKVDYIDENNRDKRRTETLTNDEVKKAVRNMYLSAAKVACDCIVRSGDKKDGKVSGWSFRHMGKGAEPSLYFSYVASTVYLGLHKRFDGADGKISKLRAFEKELLARAYQSGNPFGGDALANEIKDFAFFKDITNPEALKKTVARLTQDKFGEWEEFKNFADFLKGLSEKEKEELDLLYNYVNNGQPLTYDYDNENTNDDGCFSLLKTSLVSLASTLWNEGFGNSAGKEPFKKHMAKGPCFEDGTPVDLNVVRQSNHNNSFFNNLFVIGIVLNSAYDEELKNTNPEEHRKMLDAFRLSIQNTQRCYGEIEEEGLLYKIDSYILDFAEKADGDSAELAKQLRKVNMAVVPLMPLLLKNNNLMNEYVVKYPEKQMKESLKDIIKNKKRGKDKKRIWVWDRDGYNAITNYYYIDALIAFYRYYEKYEEVLLGNERSINSRVEEKVAEKEREKDGEIASLTKSHREELAQKNSQISEMRSVFKGFARFVLGEMIDLVDEYLAPEKLLASLSEDEKTTGKVIEALNSFTRDTDEVKVSKLVHITEKLQLLSILTMGNEDDKPLGNVIKSGLVKNAVNSRDAVLKNVLGKEGGTSDFMRNLIVSLAEKPAVKDGGAEDKNKGE